MTSAAALINKTLGHLQSFNADTQRVTTLTGSVGPSDTTFMVSPVQDGGMGLAPGVCEIGAELIYVQSVDADGNVVVPAWGRGYAGTTAASHTSDVMVTADPTFPRQRVLDAVNETVLRLFPRVFAVKVQSFTTTLPQVTYNLSDDAQRLLDARWRVPDGSGRWLAVRNVRMSRGGYDTPDLGVSVDVGDRLPPGQPIEFTYAAKPTVLASEAALFADTGLPASSEDLVVLGAVLALLPGQELSRLQVGSMEQQDRNRLVAPGSALTAARYLEQRYQLRLKEEVEALRTAYPVRVFWSSI